MRTEQEMYDTVNSFAQIKFQLNRLDHLVPVRSGKVKSACTCLALDLTWADWYRTSGR